MTVLKGMTDEELREISLRKNRKGCATQEAINAQRILYYRANPLGRVGGTIPDDAPYGRNDCADNR